MKPGENYGGEGLHEHRFMEGMPGMAEEGNHNHHNTVPH
ncbi:hypothetical protein STA3757_35610 [Stanieria sp. NIES-3757]|nr:hypothetical protein STA3757_35610 [Stanieria sp. NIES-3757]